jgi:hypothetical protein
VENFSPVKQVNINDRWYKADLQAPVEFLPNRISVQDAGHP